MCRMSGSQWDGVAVMRAVQAVGQLERPLWQKGV